MNRIVEQSVLRRSELGRPVAFYDVRDHGREKFRPSDTLVAEMLALAEARPDRKMPAGQYLEYLHISCRCGGRCGGFCACAYNNPRDVLDSEALARWTQNAAGGQFAAATFANAEIGPEFDIIVDIGTGAGNSLESILQVARANRVIAVEPNAVHRKFLADVAPEIELAENLASIGPDRTARALVVLVGVLNCAEPSLANAAARLIAGFGTAVVVHLEHERRPSANDARFQNALADGFGGNVSLAGFDRWDGRYAARVSRVGDDFAD